MCSKRIIWIVAVSVFLVLLAVVYYFVDPMQAGWMPRCIWKSITGTDCPGCGSQRMAHALMHGDLRGAWQANAYALCILPLIVFMVWLEVFRDRYPLVYRKVHSPMVIGVLSVSVFAWWIVRNLV